MTTDKNSLSALKEVVPDISFKEITKIIASFSAKASAIAALPVPIIDIAGVTFVQVRMVNEIASKYGIDSGDKSKLIISSLASNLTGRLITTAMEELASTAKVDQLLGKTLIKATISGFITTLTGEVYADHFKNGGTYEDLSFTGAIDYFKRQLNSNRVSVDNVAQAALSTINDKFDI